MIDENIYVSLSGLHCRSEGIRVREPRRAAEWKLERRCYSNRYINGFATRLMRNL